MNLRTININEFENLKRLFPGSKEEWERYKTKRIHQLENKEIDVFVIENNGEFIGEITINYISHDLETETAPNKRVYLEGFRIEKENRGKGLGQKLVNYSIETLKEKGYTEFTVGVEDDNEIAKHIYFKLGFIEPLDKGYRNEFHNCTYTLYLKKLKIVSL